MKTLEVTELLGDGIGPELREVGARGGAAACRSAVAFEPVDLSLESAAPRLGRGLRRGRGVARAHQARPEVPDGDGGGEPERGAALAARAVGDPPAGALDPGHRDRSSRRTSRSRSCAWRPAAPTTIPASGSATTWRSRCASSSGGRATEAARFAFAFARAHGLSVTSSSKHTIQRATDGFFEAIVREVAAEFPDVTPPRRAVRRAARQDLPAPARLLGRADAERVRRLPVRHGLRADRQHGPGRERQLLVREVGRDRRGAVRSRGRHGARHRRPRRVQSRPRRCSRSRSCSSTRGHARARARAARVDPRLDLAAARPRATWAGRSARPSSPRACATRWRAASR